MADLGYIKSRTRAKKVPWEGTGAYLGIDHPCAYKEEYVTEIISYGGSYTSYKVSRRKMILNAITLIFGIPIIAYGIYLIWQLWHQTPNG